MPGVKPREGLAGVQIRFQAIDPARRPRSGGPK